MGIKKIRRLPNKQQGEYNPIRGDPQLRDSSSFAIQEQFPLVL